jgi:hypothetical protein
MRFPYNFKENENPLTIMQTYLGNIDAINDDGPLCGLDDTEERQQ